MNGLSPTLSPSLDCDELLQDKSIEGRLLSYSTIVVTARRDNGKEKWSARLDWTDNLFLNPGSIEGEIFTRYDAETLSEAIDAVVLMAKRMGIVQSPFIETGLFYRGDGEDSLYHAPDGWKEALAVEAKARGWWSYLTRAEPQES